MSIQPPQGTLTIPNATLRVGRLQVDEVAGFDSVLNTFDKNTILLDEPTEISNSTQWGLKVPNIFVATFEIKGDGSSFNFMNTEGGEANAGYTLEFSETTLTLKYNDASLTTATIPNLNAAYGKVYLTYEKQYFTVTINGTRVLAYEDTSTLDRPGEEGGEFVKFFTGADGGFKNLKVVAGHLISDGTNNVSLYGGLAVTSNLEVGQANLFVDTLNTRVGVGTTEPKESLDVVGNMHLTRVSNVSQVSVDSNVVTEYTGPHDRPLRKYPEVAMTSASQGGYVVDKSEESSNGDAYAAYRAFDGIIPDGTTTIGWRTDSGYNSDTGLADGGVTRFTGDSGEWVELQLPNSIKLSSIVLKVGNDGDSLALAQRRFPKVFVIYGYNGTSWDRIQEYTTSAIQSLTDVQTFHISNPTVYHNKFVLVVKQTYSVTGATSGVTNIGELEYYGYEEGSGSLDTTLKSVYNVPATTGTQLEVYYDGRETSSYSGSGTTVNDISPNTNNGTLNGGVGFDSTYKAFTFDGTDDYIDGTITTGIDAWSHTVAFWVKIDEFNGAPFFIIDPSADGADPTASTAPHLFANTNGTLNYAFWSNAGNFLDDNGNQLIAQKGVWQHYVVQYDASTGGTNYTDRKLIINGNQTYYPAAGTATVLNMSASNNLHIGGRFTSSGSIFFNGSIANFRIYSKVLNADQVKELYDYQKDYFLGSRSSVTLYKGHLGVGVAEPSGQLELAGDERIQEYPPRGMTHSDGTPVLNQTQGKSKNITYIEGHGEFKASASARSTGSADYDGQQPYNAFEDTTGRRWLIYENVGYNTTTGAYEDNVYQLSASSGTPYGHWLKLEMPYKVNIRNYYMKANNTSHGAKDWQVWASNDGNNWTHIHSYVNETSANSFAGSNYNVSHDGHYKMFAIIVTRIFDASTEDRIDIFRVKYFGTPGPTTLDKGSLSLTRSLDVPRISRYDVDTETPRPEKLVLDFDTTVNSSPTDISGQGNHMTFHGNARYSAADKAFVFDGTTGTYMSGTQNLGTGTPAHTITGWFKRTSTLTEYTWIFTIGTAATGEMSGLLIDPQGDIVFDIFNHRIETQKRINNNEWYHFAGVFNGASSTWSVDTCDVYINGVLEPTQSTGTSPQTFNLTGNQIYFGTSTNFLRYSSCHISNFKLYNVALEPSEVRKLYNLGRTGRSMVISDTAVGIGKVPEAQLDVRGSANFTGSSVVGGSSYVGGLPSSSFDYLNPSLHLNSLPKNFLKLQVKHVGEIPSLDDFPNVARESIQPNGGISRLDTSDHHYYDISKDPYGRSCIVFRCKGTHIYSCGGWTRLNVPVSYRRSYMSVVFFKYSGNTPSSNSRFYHGCSPTNTADFSGSQATNPYFHYKLLNELTKDVWHVSIGFVHFKGASSDYDTTKGGIYRLSDMAKVVSSTEYTFYDEYDEQVQRTFFYSNSVTGAFLDIWNPGWFDTQTMFPENDILNVFTRDLTETSDDRLKSDERFIRKALDSIMKLKPQLYKKHLKLDSEDETVYEESGLMAQDIYYNTPELRHIVKPGDDYGAINSIVPVHSNNPVIDPDYSEWGKNPATVDYRGLIPYTIKAIQEMNTEMTRSKFRVLGIPYSKLTEYTGLCVRSITPDEVELTTLSNDKSVVGVISTTQNTSEYEDSEVLVESVGKGGIWVLNTNNIQNGDYLTTSNLVTGYAQVQTDDLVHSYTVAKALQDVDFANPQKPVRIIKKELSNVSMWVKTTHRVVTKDVYDKLEENVRCIITTTLPEINDEIEESVETYNEIIRDESRVQIPGYELEVRQELVNILDEHGQIQWEDDPSGATEPAYKIRYLDADGNITDEANHVHKAAFVGCTYHCG